MIRVPETSRIRQPATSVLILAVLTVVLLGSFRRELIANRLWKIGFQQSWDVYAPEPIRRLQTFEAVITYADGAESTWRTPRASALFPYPTHRWERWADSITADGSSRWWDPAARWVARTHAEPGRVARKVVLRRIWALVPPPGAGDARPTWNRVDFFTLLLR
ncbi:MAG: hypothetical protein QOC75_1630 [Pseudonocardiales bacterium]|nr:hypothetical protein [Pseudonocardiales bacterium]